MKLLNEIMNDGSRLFLLLPVGRVPPMRLLFRVFSLIGAYPTSYLPSLAESWIDFRYKGFKFSINNQFGDYWFFVSDTSCPDEVLRKVGAHFAQVLCRTA